MLRQVGSGAGFEVGFDVRTAFDFAISLAPEVGSHDDLPSADRTWLAEGRAELTRDPVMAALADSCLYLGSLAAMHPTATDANAFVHLLRATDEATFVQAVFGDMLRDVAREPLLDRARQGDAAAALEIKREWPAEQHWWVDRLLADPAALLGDLADVFEAWLPRYRQIEPRVASIIGRDVELRASDRASLAPADLVERTTNGVRWISEPGMRRIVLAPSYLARPYNFTFGIGETRIFVYPVMDAALDRDDPLAPPAAVLRLHRALGDETRLRILRMLRERDAYLTEIAERLSLSKPTIKHHLAQLRAAGLVTLTEEGGLSYFSLRRDRLDDASADLKRFLLS
jgi:DNA-binding transcriptional ArsR family regulator